MIELIMFPLYLNYSLLFILIMRKEMRSRRSDSSCTVYSHHSNSLAHLEPLDFQHKDKKD
jgi:hypothetical protein